MSEALAPSTMPVATVGAGSILAVATTEKLAFSAQEAAAAIGVGRTRFYEMLAESALKSRKMGRKRVILRDDLLAWLKGLPA
jgi:excisionase family DNA binding protein